jgi:arabinogalactan endo-1,4-beta-galactosidase
MNFPSSTLRRAALVLGLASFTAFLAAPAASAQVFAKGADVGWLQQMEATGYVFYNEQGVAQDCFALLKAKGINSIRLRVFVNPSDDKASGHCSPAEVVTMAKRATDLGFRVMIDFHYSDTWADPGKQAKPAAWASHPFSQLLTDVYDHTFNTMTALKASGVTPEWVQVGNEIPGGMLWPEGSTKNFPQLAQLITKGYEAIKAVSPTSKVIVHLDRGNDNAMYRSFFDQLASNGGKFDVIGMSYYPYWLKQDYTASIANLRTNLQDMVTRYPGKEVVVAEVGGDYTAVQNTYDMLVAVQQAVRAVPQGKGLGVFYWEPEGAKSWSGYQLSAWGDDGKPSPALKAFLDEPKDKAGKLTPSRPAKAAKRK